MATEMIWSRDPNTTYLCKWPTEGQTYDPWIGNQMLSTPLKENGMDKKSNGLVQNYCNL